ncbi:SpoIIE family protein phosphatase [uncultured Piscinibacter sp.]|uniref:PP2C family protein-serine/threonine phosphatase n=1 Tax=uncultured Piscinibacter sp. TaxID=1131835 RepID=UPI00260EE736|nr:SpoIIE family protein phosphatase [uncultured Piscinibacter sp.]
MDLGVLSQAAKAPIFQGVPAGALEPLLVGLPLLDVTEDLRLLQRGDANQSVMLVLQGSLHVSLDQSDSGDFIEVAAGECAGEMSVIDDQPVSAHVVAVAGTRLLLIDSLTFLDRVLAMPRVARNLMSAMAERMRRSDRLTISRMRQLMALEQARRELAFAHDIQSSLLPAESLFAGDVRLDCAGRMRPARDVGGDFYDLFFLDEHRLLFVIADVCGKGLPAALFMVRAIAAHQFITAFCGVLDLHTHRLQYVNAGHHPPLVAPAGQPFTYLEGPISPLVGMIPGLCDRSDELELAPGSALPLYTDGVTEAEDAERRLFGEARLLQCLQSQARAAAARLLDAVFAEVDAFAGGALQSDDNGQGTRPSSTAWQRLRSVVAAASAHGVSREAVFRSAARSSAQSPLMEVQLTLYASRPSEEARAAASSINELLLPPLLGRSVCGLHHPEEDVQRGAVGSVALLGT